MGQNPVGGRMVAQAIRYMGFREIVARKAIPPGLVGSFLGAILGLVIGDLKRRSATDKTRDKSGRPFGLPDFLAILVMNSVLIMLLLDVGSGSGRVYHGGHDQFYWCEQLEWGKEPQRPQAVRAACSLLEGKPFVCRSRMITALGKCGKDAESAIPVLKELALDEELSAREAAIRALGQLAGPSPSPGAESNRQAP